MLSNDQTMAAIALLVDLFFMSKEDFPRTLYVASTKGKFFKISVHETGRIRDSEYHKRHLKGERRAATVQRAQIVGPSTTHTTAIQG